MRKLLILIGLFLTLSLSGQIMPGVVASQGGVVAAACDDGMLNNGCFNDGDTGWTDDNTNFPIASGYAEFKDLASAYIEQSAANMGTAMARNVGYTLTFDFTLLTGGTINITIRDHVDNVMATLAYTSANNGSNSVNFTTLNSGADAKGIRITCSSSSTGTCRFDNFKLVAQ